MLFSISWKALASFLRINDSAPVTLKISFSCTKWHRKPEEKDLSTAPWAHLCSWHPQNGSSRALCWHKARADFWLEGVGHSAQGAGWHGGKERVTAFNPCRNIWGPENIIQNQDQGRNTRSREITRHERLVAQVNVALKQDGLLGGVGSLSPLECEGTGLQLSGCCRRASNTSQEATSFCSVLPSSHRNWFSTEGMCRPPLSVQRFAFPRLQRETCSKCVYRHLRCERCDYLQNLISYLPILVELNIAKIFSFVFGMVCF